MVSHKSFVFLQPLHHTAMWCFISPGIGLHLLLGLRRNQHMYFWLLPSRRSTCRWSKYLSFALIVSFILEDTLIAIGRYGLIEPKLRYGYLYVSVCIYVYLAIFCKYLMKMKTHFLQPYIGGILHWEWLSIKKIKTYSDIPLYYLCFRIIVAILSRYKYI
jgi:hypothetical protein